MSKHEDDGQMQDVDELLRAIDARLDGLESAEDSADFQSFRAQCASSLGVAPDAQERDPSEVLRARRVARRVLRASTRENLGRRGDAAVLWSFVTDRLRDSRTLRVLAAALLVQVTVVPVVAYHMIKKARPPVIDVEFTPRYQELLDDMPKLTPENYDLPEPEIEVPLELPDVEEPR